MTVGQVTLQSRRPHTWWHVLRSPAVAILYGVAFAVSVGLAIGDIRWIASNGHQLPLGGQIGLDLMFSVLLAAFGAVTTAVVVQRALPAGDDTIPASTASRRAAWIVGVGVAHIAVGVIINLATP
ncbi:MAG: hypothetical protein JWM34_4619 [Ilumatobacteraceae bacterium]|nr:hypothetical protein [Ilumatobacteraceae bacterium]